MAGITFGPTSSLSSTECIDVDITRDFIVEETETFNFFIAVIQSDPAVTVGSPNTALVTIVDEEGGRKS